MKVDDTRYHLVWLGYPKQRQEMARLKYRLAFFRFWKRRIAILWKQACTEKDEAIFAVVQKTDFRLIVGKSKMRK